MQGIKEGMKRFLTPFYAEKIIDCKPWRQVVRAEIGRWLDMVGYEAEDVNPVAQTAGAFMQD
jgi:hypothetical protein